MPHAEALGGLGRVTKSNCVERVPHGKDPGRDWSGVLTEARRGRDAGNCLGRNHNAHGFRQVPQSATPLPKSHLGAHKPTRWQGTRRVHFEFHAANKESVMSTILLVVLLPLGFGATAFLLWKLLEAAGATSAADFDLPDSR
jgi:hypothetical protein